MIEEARVDGCLIDFSLYRTGSVREIQQAPDVRSERRRQSQSGRRTGQSAKAHQTGFAGSPPRERLPDFSTHQCAEDETDVREASQMTHTSLILLSPKAIGFEQVDAPP